MKDTKIAIIYGTRPEIIKLAPIVRECEKRGVLFFCIHSGQHYSYEMDEVFFDELNLQEPKYKLEIGQKGIAGHGGQTGVMLTEIEKILLDEKPSVVVVQGDTNTVLAGALSAVKIPYNNGERIHVAHVEAGLRSYDERMPEETNRVIVDHISNFLFTPTKSEEDILLDEGISNNKIFTVGNTIVDMVIQSVDLAKEKSKILQNLNLNKDKYILLTLHRQENVDSKEVFADIVSGLSLVIEETKLPIIFPIHPRTQKKLNEFGIQLPGGVQTIKPIGYLDFISLEKNSALILTDSGGLQEEACILQVPCVTLRNNTERPETIDVGANVIAGTKPSDILRGVKESIKKERGWENPFGDGKSAKKIIDIITK